LYLHILAYTPEPYCACRAVRVACDATRHTHSSYPFQFYISIRVKGDM